jgi:hypothetical protein
MHHHHIHHIAVVVGTAVAVGAVVTALAISNGQQKQQPTMHLVARPIVKTGK